MRDCGLSALLVEEGGSALFYAEYLEAARTNPEVDEKLVDALVDYDPIDNPAETDKLSTESPNIDADVTTYSAGSSPPNQPSAADDD